jgi:hypothetical protein
MLSGVISDANDAQVFQAVIRSVSVLVVDMFIRRQLSPKMALHDDAMFQSVCPASGKLHIAIMPDFPSDDSVFNAAAVHRAEPDPFSSAARLDAEHVSTSFAGDIDQSRASIVTEHFARILANGTALNGLRAHTTGSKLGFSAVPHPSHVRASSVAGAVISIVFG